jgi:hypothetical protein
MRAPGDLILHDPSAIEPEGFDWTAYLLELDAAATVSASTWTVSTVAGDASPMTLSGPAIVAGSLKTQVTLNAGTVGYRYTVTNHITTSTGVQDDRSFKVLVVQR